MLTYNVTMCHLQIAVLNISLVIKCAIMTLIFLFISHGKFNDVIKWLIILAVQN